MISKLLIRRIKYKILMSEVSIYELIEQIIFLKLCEEFPFKNYQKFDKDIKKIRDNLINPNPEKNYKKIEKYKEFCINNLEKDIDIKSYIQLYFLLGAYKISFSDKSMEENLIRYSEKYGPVDKRINDNNFCFYKEKINKELRIKNKEVAELKKKITNKYMSDKNEKKINFSFDNFTFLIKLCSIMYLIGGYIYIYFYLLLFNINVTNYYNLTDYIDGSLDIVNLTLITSGFVLLSLILKERSLNKEKLRVKIFGHLPLHWAIDIFIELIVIIVLILLWYWVFRTIPLYLILGYIIPVIYSLLLDRKIMKRFKKPKIVTIIIIFQLVFFSLMIEKIIDNREIVISGGSNMNYSMHKKNKKYEGLSVITINSNYIFLWDKDRKKTVIVPLLSNSNLESIEVESSF